MPAAPRESDESKQAFPACLLKKAAMTAAPQDKHVPRTPSIVGRMCAPHCTSRSRSVHGTPRVRFACYCPSCGIGTPALLDIAVRTVVSPAGRLRFLRRRDRSIGGPGREGRGGGRRMGVPDVRRAGSRGRWMGRARLYYWQTDDCCACVIVFLPTRGAFHDKTRLPHGRYGSRASWRRTLKRC